MRGLYLHIPFCLQKCHYCDFVITVDRSPETRERFFRAVEREADQAAQRHGRLQFDTLYLGGGTPSALSPDEMGRLFGIVRERFAVDAEAEVTCEVNPGDVDAKKLAAYRALGINRISVGAQSFNDPLLAEMNRPHDASAIEETASTLRKLGFLNVSLDLILRLPGQTLKDAQDSVERAVALGSTQVVLYDLGVHEKTVYGRRLQRGELKLPDEAAHERMFARAEEILEQAGYLHYEVANFARPGFESRHNLLYWTNQEYLGLGPGAFCYLNGVRRQFARGVGRYLAKCEAGDWTNDEQEQISDENREIETLLTGLRLSRGVELNGFPIVRPRLEPALRELSDQGLVETAAGRAALTRRGRYVAESVIGKIVTDCLPPFLLSQESRAGLP